MGNRIYNKNDTTQHFKGAVYDALGVFGVALTEAQIKGASDGTTQGNATLLNIIKAMEGTVTVALTTEADAISWKPEWNGKVVVLSGKGSLALETVATVATRSTASSAFAPAALYLADGTDLTLSTPMGQEIVADTLWVGKSVTLSANFTAPPEKSGTYAVLRSADGAMPPLNGTVTYPTGANVYCNEETALNGGEVTIAVIQQDSDGAYLLGSPADYEWYLTQQDKTLKLRMTADIALEAKTYTAVANYPTCAAFDGAGHTLTLPEGGSFSGAEGAALVVASSDHAVTIKDLKVEVMGTITGKGNVGAVVGFFGNAGGKAALDIDNVWVRIGSTGKIASAGSSAGLVGGTWGEKGTFSNIRVELDPGAQLTSTETATNTARGVAGILGGANGNQKLQNALVVVGKEVTFSGASGRGLVLGRNTHDTPTLDNCVAVDFGAKASGLKASAVGTPTLFCAEASTFAETAGAVLVETGTIQARDGATVTLLQNTEAACLVLPETMPEGAAWKMAKAEGANTVTVSPTDSPALNPGATLPLEYAFHAFASAPKGTLWDDTVTAICTPTMLVDGWAELRNEADYRWYGTEGRDGTLNVRMANDITLESGQTYPMNAGLTTTFDGNGHTLHVPADTQIVSTVEWSYGGCLADSLNGATIKDVTVDFRGTIVTKGTYGRTAGVIVGTTQWDGKTSTFSNVRAYIGERASLQSDKTGAFTGNIYAAISTSNCVLLDSGVKHGKTLFTGKPTNAKLYTGNTVTTEYGNGNVNGTYCLGEQEGVIEDGKLTLTEAEGLKVVSTKAEDGWTLEQEGNTVTVSGGSGVCSLTYGLEGFPGVEIPVSFTPMALTLPEGVTATPEQKALLMAKAIENKLPVPAPITFRTGAKEPTLDALEVFEGILRAENGGLVVGYDFGISKIAVEKAGETGEPTIAVTVRVQDDLGQPASFAKGAQVNLVRTSNGSSLLSAPVSLTAGDSEGTVTFPLPAETELFRAHIEKANN